MTTPTNNFEQISKLLKFDSEDDFYHLQIIKRKKEHKELGSNSYVVKTYYIRSLEYLEQKREEIIALCEHHNARACINLNRRSFERIAYHMMRKVVDQIMNKDWKSVRKAYESVCGAHSNEKEKRWILDVDNKDEEAGRILIADIRNCEPERRTDKVIDIVPTKNGYHIITKPFNVEEFKALHPEIDVHKDNPTILYIPCSR